MMQDNVRELGAGPIVLLAMLQGYYSLPTMTRFSRELVLGRKKTSYQFGLVRNGELTVPEFCYAMLSGLILLALWSWKQ